MSTRPGVLLTGGTAQVGLHLLPALQVAGFSTLALSRKINPGVPTAASPSAHIYWMHPGQLASILGETNLPSTARNLPAPLQNLVTLVSTGPIALAMEWLPRLPEIRTVVCLSTSSVLSKADSGNQAERQQIAGIIRVENQLMEHCAERGIVLCLLRPTLIYGCGMDENISRIAAFIRRFGFLPLAGKASGLRQPIHVADLAELLARASQADLKGQSAYVVAGGSILSYREMAARIFQALGKPPRLFSLPPGLMIAAAALLQKLGVLQGLNPSMVERQNQDLVFDDREARQLFGFQPRNFQPGPADFNLPDELQAMLPPALQPG